MKRVTKHCPMCDSEDIVCDAWAEWDVETQRWVQRDFFDNCYCNDCDHSFDRTACVEKPAEDVHEMFTEGR
jgi:hypothetical protein